MDAKLRANDVWGILFVLLVANGAMAGIPANDQCVNAEVIAGDGTFPFDQIQATTTGPVDPACNFFGFTVIDSEVWFCWTADQTGSVRIETCGQTAVDTKMAVYASCNCPPSLGSNLACNDDACGVQSGVTISATVGEQFMIRLGTFPGAMPGVGTLSIATGGEEDCILQADDCLATAPACGTTTYRFGSLDLPAIPADFFDPGSEPFTGTVQLVGDQSGVLFSDTELSRLEDACLDDGPASIAIELLAMNLESCAPVTVFVGGEPELWNVQVSLAPGTSQEGGMQVGRTSGNRGLLDFTVPIQPVFLFERQSDQVQRTWDTAAEGIAPLIISASEVPWVQSAPELDSCALDFLPGANEVEGSACCGPFLARSDLGAVVQTFLPPNCSLECPVDCNGNLFGDDFDISGSTSVDCNSNGVPDECDPCDAGDYDGDGLVNAVDTALFLECFAGPGQTPNTLSSECRQACLDAFDLDADGDVDLADYAHYMRLFDDNVLLKPRDFGVRVLAGGVEHPDAGLDINAAGYAYDGVPLDLVITHRPGLSPPPVTLRVYEGGNGAPPAEVFASPLSFDAGFSQSIILPASSNGAALRLVVESSVQALTIYRFATQPGPAVSAQAMDCVTYRALTVGQSGPQSSLDLQLDLGTDGILIDPGDPITNLQPDDPLAGAVGTSDGYIVRLFDAAGRPAAHQPIRVMPTNAAVLGVRPTGASGAAGASSMVTTTDESGFLVARMVYADAGSSQVQLFSEVVPPVPIPAPAIGGGPAIFVGSPPPPAPLVSGLRVTRCITNAGLPNESSTPLNAGLTEDAPLLTFGSKYELAADLNVPLEPGLSYRWCVERFGNEVQVDELDGRICISAPDPNPGQAGDKVHVGLSVKIVQAGKEGVEAVSGSVSLDFDFVEKKTIAICPVQFGIGQSVAGWASIESTLNGIYNGSGVCFTVDPIDDQGGAAKQLCLRVTDSATTNAVACVDVEGALVDCVCDNAALQGQDDKIVVYNGVRFRFADGTDPCQGDDATTGFALGGDEVAAMFRLKLSYLAGGKWANTVAMGAGRLAEDGGDGDLAHEIAHILGLTHVDESDTNNLMHPQAETVTQQRRQLQPGQVATLYREACEVVAGQ